jgi:hypothetical protein
MRSARHKIGAGAPLQRLLGIPLDAARAAPAEPPVQLLRSGRSGQGEVGHLRPPEGKRIAVNLGTVSTPRSLTKHSAYQQDDEGGHAIPGSQ